MGWKRKAALWLALAWSAALLCGCAVHDRAAEDDADLAESLFVSHLEQAHLLLKTVNGDACAAEDFSAVRSEAALAEGMTLHLAAAQDMAARQEGFLPDALAEALAAYYDAYERYLGVLARYVQNCDGPSNQARAAMAQLDRQLPERFPISGALPDPGSAAEQMVLTHLENAAQAMLRAAEILQAELPEGV